MKKQTNIAALKELVNNNVLENVRLRINGVQAYNIAEGEEYTVIVKYAKQGGRYYFIDREGRRFLASRYDRAEFVAGEMLEVIANESAAATNAADQVEASGSVLVCADLLTLAATYGAQRTAAALRAARRFAIRSASWLRASHEFCAQDGDPIRCTGWQLVGFNIAAAAVVLLLCIKY